MHDIEAYTHEDSRPVIPNAGRAQDDTTPETPHTYSFDPHASPALNWAGKSESNNFTVLTSSIHKHETITPHRIIFTVLKSEAKSPERQGYLFPEVSFTERLNRSFTRIEAYTHSENWQTE